MIIYIHAASNNSTIKRFTKFTSIFKSKKHVVTQKHFNFIPDKAGRQISAASKQRSSVCFSSFQSLPAFACVCCFFGGISMFQNRGGISIFEKVNMTLSLKVSKSFQNMHFLKETFLKKLAYIPPLFQKHFELISMFGYCFNLSKCAAEMCIRLSEYFLNVFNY